MYSQALRVWTITTVGLKHQVVQSCDLIHGFWSQQSYKISDIYSHYCYSFKPYLLLSGVVFKWVCQNQNQSNNYDQSQEKQTTQWMNQGVWTSYGWYWFFFSFADKVFRRRGAAIQSQSKCELNRQSVRNENRFKYKVDFKFAVQYKNCFIESYGTFWRCFCI